MTADLTLDLPDLIVPEHIPEATIEERAQAFHEANPWVLANMIALADAYRARGATRVGVKHLAEIIRWEHGRATQGDAFRFNNSHTSRFARLMVERRPDLADLIETRKLRVA